MTGPVTVRIEGLREVEQAMKELTKAAAKSQGRKALMAGGEVLSSRAYQLAPKDEGYLADSIDVGTKLTRRQKSLHRKAADVEVFVGPNDPAAVPQEFGWEGNPPQPFMRPAWDETHDAVLKRTADVLMVGVDKAVQRARAKAIRNGS